MEKYLIKSKFCPVQEQYFHVNLFSIQITACYKHKASRERDWISNAVYANHN